MAGTVREREGLSTAVAPARAAAGACTVPGPVGLAADPLALAGALGNRRMTALLGVARVGGWSGEDPGSDNAGELGVSTVGGKRQLRRIPLEGIAAPGAKTDKAIVVLPARLTPGAPLDVLLHLHGFQLKGYAVGYDDPDGGGPKMAADLGIYQIETQMATASREMIGILPQGSAKSDFSSGSGKAFDADAYVDAVFARLTTLRGWVEGGTPVGDKPPAPPTRGRVALSGHSGADQPIAEMLGSAGGAKDLAPEGLYGLFLFDSMILGEKEDPSKPAFAGAVWDYVWRRLDALLAELRALRGSDDLATAGPRMRDHVLDKGFRLNVAYWEKGSYGFAAGFIRRKRDAWLTKAADVIGPSGSTVEAALRGILRVEPVATDDHMKVLAAGAQLRTAIDNLPPPPAPTVAPPAPTAPTQTPAPTAPTQTPAPSQTIQRDEDPPDYDAEYASFAQRGAVEGGLAGYKDIRALLIDTFGSIAQANTYYRGVRGSEFLGERPPVHAATLGVRLAAAERWLADRSSLAEATAGFTSIGGFNIRRNRNKRSVLSDHSFGWAVDLDAKLNPNMHGRFPGRAMTAVTGRAVVTGALDEVAAGGTGQELLAPIEEVREASRDFEAAFADEAALGKAMRAYAVDRLRFDLGADVDLLAMVKTAAGSGRGGRAARAALADLLADNWGNLAALEEHQQAEEREQVVANEGWTAWKKKQAKREKDEAKAHATMMGNRQKAAQKAERMTAAGKSDEQIRAAVHAPLEAAEAKAFRAGVRARADKAAGTMIELWNIFTSSFQNRRTRTGPRAEAQVEGTPGTIAAHGFMDMPSVLVAALTGSDAGNLDWLGAGTARDFMHFQLKPDQRPPLRG